VSDAVLNLVVILSLPPHKHKHITSMMDADLPAASPSPLRNRSLEEYRAQCQCLLVSIRHAERLDMRFENWLDRVRANDTAFIKAHLSIDPARLAMHQKNTPLTRAGVRQARHTAEELFATLGMSPKTDVVLLLSSPYLRCVQTANELASVFGVPIGIEYGLKELHDPIWYPIVPVLHSASEVRVTERAARAAGLSLDSRDRCVVCARDAADERRSASRHHLPIVHEPR